MTVVKVVPGGPSEAAGLQDGDRIVKVNDSIVAGRNMNTDKIMSLMRGEIGTDVQLTIVRRGEKQPLIKNITREVFLSKVWMWLICSTIRPGLSR